VVLNGFPAAVNAAGGTTTVAATGPTASPGEIGAIEGIAATTTGLVDVVLASTTPLLQGSTVTLGTCGVLTVSEMGTDAGSPSYTILSGQAIINTLTTHTGDAGRIVTDELNLSFAGTLSNGHAVSGCVNALGQ
jgi:hypothetical protein